MTNIGAPAGSEAAVFGTAGLNVSRTAAPIHLGHGATSPRAGLAGEARQVRDMLAHFKDNITKKREKKSSM